MDVFHLHYINILVLVMVSFTLFYNHFQLEYYVIAIFTIVCFYYSLFFCILRLFFSCNAVCLFSSFSFIIRPQNANKNTHHFITSIHLACITYLHLIYAFFFTLYVCIFWFFLGFICVVVVNLW